jgi:hypothetical protein
LIAQIKIEFIKVKIAKYFSKLVLENTLPIVFRTKIVKKTHKIIVTVFFPKKKRTYSPFCKRTKMKNEFIKIESVSKTYISSTVFNLPPQVIS